LKPPDCYTSGEEVLREHADGTPPFGAGTYNRMAHFCLASGAGFASK